MVATFLLALVGACSVETDSATLISAEPMDGGGSGSTSTTEAVDPTTTSTTEADRTTTTEAGGGPVDVCAEVDPADVAAILGPDASAGTPVTISAPDDGCTWSNPAGDVLGAARVAADDLPTELESAVVFPLFGLPGDGYRQSSITSSGNSTETSVIVEGYVDSTTPEPDALDPIFDALDGG